MNVLRVKISLLDSYGQEMASCKTFCNFLQLFVERLQCLWNDTKEDMQENDHS